MRTMTMIQDKRYVNKLIVTVRFQMMSEHLIRLQQVKSKKTISSTVMFVYDIILTKQFIKP